MIKGSLMTHPVFFSVGGTDVALAEKVKEYLPDRLVYLYSRTGEEVVVITKELSQELQDCKLFVCFWSKRYLTSAACRWEFATAKERLQNGSLKIEQFLIIEVDVDRPSYTKAMWENPLSKNNESVLGVLSDIRATPLPFDAQRLASAVNRSLDKIAPTPEVSIPRLELKRQFQEAMDRPSMRVAGLCFVTGLPGHGKRTAIHSYMQDNFKHLHAKQIVIDNLEGPEDMLQRMASSLGQSNDEIASFVQNVSGNLSAAQKVLQELLDLAQSRNIYFIICQDEFAAVDGAPLPYWVLGLFRNAGIQNSPKVFYVAKRRIPDALFDNFSASARFHVQGLDEDEAALLVTRLIHAYGGWKESWNEENKKIVISASGSSPSLCVEIFRLIRLHGNLDFLPQIAEAAAKGFSSGLTQLVQLMIAELKGKDNELLALYAIDRLGLISKTTLDEIVKPICDAKGYDLYQLLEIGFVELLSDGVYRIPPLLQRRLGNVLFRGVDKEKFDARLKAFAVHMPIADKEYDSITIKNKITAQLISDIPQAPDFAVFVTPSVLFKAGWRSYQRSDYSVAHKTFSRAFARIRDVLDVQAKIEIVRFFGLACARQSDEDGFHQAIQTLSDVARMPKFASSANAMVHFLKGFKFRLARLYPDAIEEFTKGERYLRDSRFAASQKGAILAELALAREKSRSPASLPLAVEAARESFKVNPVIPTLDTLVRVLIHQCFNDDTVAQTTFDSNTAEIDLLIADLSGRCDSVGDARHFLRKAQLEAEWAEHDYKNIFGNPVDRDLGKAVFFAEKAYEKNMRTDIQSVVWKYKFLDAMTDWSNDIEQQTLEVLSAHSTSRIHFDHALKYYVLSIARRDVENAKKELRRFRSRASSATGDYVNQLLIRQENINDLLAQIALNDVAFD
jgi:hypothetical protein